MCCCSNCCCCNHLHNSFDQSRRTMKSSPNLRMQLPITIKPIQMMMMTLKPAIYPLTTSSRKWDLKFHLHLHWTWCKGMPKEWSSKKLKKSAKLEIFNWSIFFWFGLVWSCIGWSYTNENYQKKEKERTQFLTTINHVRIYLNYYVLIQDCFSFHLLTHIQHTCSVVKERRRQIKDFLSGRLV